MTSNDLNAQRGGLPDDQVLGYRFPGGKYTIQHWENFLLTDCTTADQLPDGLVHPVALFHVPILGAGTSITKLFELGGAKGAGSVGLEGYDWEYDEPLREDVEYRINYDTTKFVRASIEEVVSTFWEAALLVLVIIFVFLQSLRTTLIPMIAIPVSIIGTFGVMLAMHFSINTLTLLGAVLAIGLVVDDAIVARLGADAQGRDATGERPHVLLLDVVGAQPVRDLEAHVVLREHLEKRVEMALVHVRQLVEEVDAARASRREIGDHALDFAFRRAAKFPLRGQLQQPCVGRRVPQKI